MSAETWYEATKHNQSKWMDQDVPDTYAAYRRARRLRDRVANLERDIADRDINHSWNVYDDPAAKRQEALDYLAEVRLEAITAQQLYERMAASDLAEQREYQQLMDGLRHG